MRLPKILLASLLTLALVACGIAVPPEKSAYVGTWESSNMLLKIDADGKVNYKRRDGNSTTSIDAPIKSFQGDDFVVGVGPLTTTFKVTAKPHQEGSAWKMTVDGVELTKTQ
ncbi:MAG: hypothetical protein JSR34_12180 [Proteobacteria bacterium]|nr:hypothetical protein [Pseudomonadota bacterium]